MSTFTRQIDRGLVAQYGREAVEIGECGHYRAPSGLTVDIEALLLAAVKGTVSYPPNTTIPEKISGQHDTVIEVVNETASYGDTWKIANPSDPGNPWPLFLEDQYPPPFFVQSVPFERIDLFFSRDMQVISAEQVLALYGNLPPYGSDHAGVIATFRP